jgi:putative endopeptidase
MKPMWKTSINNVERKLGELLGKEYVKRHFSFKAKSKVKEMIIYIKNVLSDKLTDIDWLLQETKVKALLKLHKMNFKIGYPDKWRNYDNLQLDNNKTYLENNIFCNRFNNLYELSFAYKPVDKNRWFINVHEINAYYSPSYNEIVFPAGILQEPFFSDKYDMAVNFGAIGAIIGHEITHGFDDLGRNYDADGNLVDWWLKEDAKKYKEKTDVIKEQYSNYEFHGHKINGSLTLGENIADIGGLSIAYASLKKYLVKNPDENKLIDGLTPEQRFFLSYSRIWRCNIRKEYLILKIMMKVKKLLKDILILG